MLGDSVFKAIDHNETGYYSQITKTPTKYKNIALLLQPPSKHLPQQFTLLIRHDLLPHIQNDYLNVEMVETTHPQQ